MKTPNVLLGLGLVTAGVLTAAICLVKGVRIEEFHDTKAKGGEVRHPWDEFAVHASRPVYLTIGGRTYYGVRGSPPYYLSVPGTNAVLFVTENDGKVNFYVVSRINGTAVEIDGKGSTFGWEIGSKRTVGEPFTDWIESATNGRIVLVTRTDWGKAITLLDLPKRRLTQVENVYLDANEKVTNRVVYPKGN